MRKVLLALLLIWYSFNGHSQDIQNYPYDHEIFASVYSNGMIYAIANGEPYGKYFLGYKDGEWEVFDSLDDGFYQYHQHITVWQDNPVVFESYSSDSARVIRYFPDGSREVVLEGHRFGFSSINDTSSCSVGQHSRFGILRANEDKENLQVFVSTIGSNG